MGIQPKPKRAVKPKIGDVVYFWEWQRPGGQPPKKVLARWVIYNIEDPRSKSPWYQLRKLTGKRDYKGFWKVTTGSRGPFIPEAEAKLIMALKGIK